jgi:hypothetical protein
LVNPLPYITHARALPRASGLQYGEPQCLEAIRLLAGAGANLYLSTWEGTALHLACKRGSGPLAADVIQLLVELMEDAGPPSISRAGGRQVAWRGRVLLPGPGAAAGLPGSCVGTTCHHRR